MEGLQFLRFSSLSSQLQGADLAWSDGDGLQALHWAARQGHTSALQALLEAGANAEGRGALLEKIPVEAAAADDWLPLHFAAQNGHVEVVQVGGGSQW
eukprot:Skav216331  [mRNA]  locus=scaffold3350:210644:212036:+ [translate_table: standard]